jgi:hypothetical protein
VPSAKVEAIARKPNTDSADWMKLNMSLVHDTFRHGLLHVENVHIEKAEIKSDVVLDATGAPFSKPQSLTGME